ncbi:MAG TPA: beta-eliminating lyase-related protein [Usitatibacteraceae bacterium]|nr:beta-eliminating lyase-related protein [Usitatibacteraceae bacterium]
MLAIADWMARHEYGADEYGTGQLIDDFEHKVAAVLGKEAAVYMPSGTMASLIALRIWADRAHNPDFGMHATAHQELHEELAYRKLHQLRGHVIGQEGEPLLARDLAYLDLPLSSIVIELPMREIGGRLAPWEDLQRQRQIATSRGVRLHLDGARLWETRSFYEARSYAEIAALFDSVYVSLYKGIGGLSGAMLAGDKAFIAEARTWLARHGGTVYRQYPIVASAAMRFDARLERMPHYYQRALSLARSLHALPGVAVRPEVPEVNLMHLRFDMPPHRWEAARDTIAASERIWLGKPRAVAVQPVTDVEIYAGEGLMALSDDEVVGAYQKLLVLARMSGP